MSRCVKSRDWPVPVDPLLRFLRYVIISDGCWRWIGSKTSGGYGQFPMNGKNHNASRAMWVLLNGTPRASLHICHTCDNRECVRPSHLFAGTRSDNMRDCRNKGRLHLGSLTGRDVRSVRALHARGVGPAKISRRFGVTRRAIYDVVTGETWVGHE